MERPDEELLLSAQKGDRDALSQLLLKYGPGVRRQLKINPKWRALLEEDDVMQATYVEAFQQISEFRSTASAFPGWLSRIAQNNLRDAIDWLQRRKRPQPEDRLFAPPDQDTVVWLYELITDSSSTPSRKLAAAEMYRFLEEELATLPVRYRNVLRLIYFDGKGVPEVAGEFGCTSGAVHLLRIRAIDCLRRRFARNPASLVVSEPH